MVGSDGGTLGRVVARRGAFASSWGRHKPKFGEAETVGPLHTLKTPEPYTTCAPHVPSSSEEGFKLREPVQTRLDGDRLS